MKERAAQAACRSCGRSGLVPVLDLGETPLADRLPTAEQLTQPEPRFPLQVAFCPECSLMQILETVPPEQVFDAEYPYYSSFSPYLLDHSRKNALELVETRKLGSESLVVELASNDGYLLKNYVEQGIAVLGIDPVPGPAAAAVKIGVPTLQEFFTRELAAQLADEGKQADVIHANNVLAHVADTNGFVAGIGTLLKEDGVAVIEFPYVRDLIDHCEFDTIYHEHLCYFSATSVDHLLRHHGLYLNDVRRLPIHGGSLRLYVEKREHVSSAVRAMLASEKELGIDRPDYYLDFSARVVRLKQELLTLLRGLKGRGKRLAAYGAAAKGATLINYVGIGRDLVEFVVDRNVHKQGRHMPGQHLPIRAPEELLKSKPDVVLMLSWNFADEILQQQAAYREQGGQFIIPVPKPHLV
jgi:SAM-dependent methyltransferase